MRVQKGQGLAALITVLALGVPGALSAQTYGGEEGPALEFGASLDIANSYVWHGLRLTDDPNLQPAIWLNYGPLEVGSWSVHGLDGEYNELDFWITYYFPESSLGALSLTFNDYYQNPEFGEDFLEFDGVGPCEVGEEGYGSPSRCAQGTHTVEMVGALTLAAAPVDLFFAYNVHNDPENALYAEAAYRPLVAGFDLGFTVGGVLGESNYYYGADSTALTNLSAMVGREFGSDRFSVPVAVEFIRNPLYEENYVMARAGILVWF